MRGRSRALIAFGVLILVAIVIVAIAREATSRRLVAAAILPPTAPSRPPLTRASFIRWASEPPTRSERSASSSGRTSSRPTERGGREDRIAGYRCPCCPRVAPSGGEHERKSQTCRVCCGSGRRTRCAPRRRHAEGRRHERYEAAASDGATRLRESQ